MTKNQNKKLMHRSFYTKSTLINNVEGFAYCKLYKKIMGLGNVSRITLIYLCKKCKEYLVEIHFSHLFSLATFCIVNHPRTVLHSSLSACRIKDHPMFQLISLQPQRRFHILAFQPAAPGPSHIPGCQLASPQTIPLSNFSTCSTRTIPHTRMSACSTTDHPIF